jgi:hypothetical protein
MQTIDLSCQCGQVQGQIVNFSVKTSNRVVCHCQDCRRFTQWTGHGEMISQHGGVDIVQVAQSQVTLTKGADQIRCARLSKKGLYRFYAACCRMPLGNAMSRGVPFVGLPTPLIVQSARASVDIGLPVGIYGGSALSPPPNAHRRVPAAMMLRIARLMLKWKFTMRNDSSPFFRADGTAVATPTIIER